jgi:hypothetical protein
MWISSEVSGVTEPADWGERFVYDETARLVFLWLFPTAQDTINRGSGRVDLGRSSDSVQMNTQCNTRYRDEACMDHGSRMLGKR